MISRINELINYINDISEAKQVGTLYHFTYLSNMLLILQNNKLESTWSIDTRNFSISFTRNKNFKKGYIYNVPLEAAFIIDGNKLSEHYKIYPIEYYYTQRGISPSPEAKESEERISFSERGKVINDFKKYVIGIILYPKEYKKTKFYKKYKWSYEELKKEIESYGIAVHEDQITNEKYITTVKSPWAEADIYKDPSPSDISHLIKNSSQSGNSMGFKFVVDLEKEDVYIWDAFTSLHQPVVDKLGIARNNDWRHLAGGNIIRKDGEYTVYWDSLTFRNSKDEIFKAGLLLNLYIKHN